MIHWRRSFSTSRNVAIFSSGVLLCNEIDELNFECEERIAILIMAGGGHLDGNVPHRQWRSAESI